MSTRTIRAGMQAISTGIPPWHQPAACACCPAGETGDYPDACECDCHLSASDLREMAAEARYDAEREGALD